MSKIKIMCTSTGCIDYAPERYKSLGLDIIRIHVFLTARNTEKVTTLTPQNSTAVLKQ